MSGLHLPGPDMSGVVILVSGGRRVGKTTLLLALREEALAHGLDVGGFLSVARFVDGEKTGIGLMDAATGACVPLAEFRAEPLPEGDTPRTQHYVFDPAALESGVRFAASGCEADVFFVDELGPLELARGEGWADVIPMVRARGYGVALVVVRPDLVPMGRAALDVPPDAPLIVVTEESRDMLVARLAEWIGQRVPRITSGTGD